MSEIETLEAEGAALREALRKISGWIDCDEPCGPTRVICGTCGTTEPRTCVGCTARAALASTAGQAFLERLRKVEQALTAINDIRNSIVGTQSFNWSEHAYPLVSALDEAGFVGMEYPAAREYFGTLIERKNSAEAERDAAITRAEAFKEAETEQCKLRLAAENECGVLRARAEKAEGHKCTAMNERDALRAELEGLRSATKLVAWHRDGIGPDVPVLQERYDRLRADLETAKRLLGEVLRALEGSFPPGDESVGIQEFPTVDLSEAWDIRVRGRAFLNPPAQALSEEQKWVTDAEKFLKASGFVAPKSPCPTCKDTHEVYTLNHVNDPVALTINRSPCPDCTPGGDK